MSSSSAVAQGDWQPGMLELLPPTACCLGTDVSPVNVTLATNRLEAWGNRAQVRLVDGSMPFPTDSNSADRIVCTYVFDLLDDTDVVAVLGEFERMLTSDALLCLVSRRTGITGFERLISGLRTMVWRWPRSWWEAVGPSGWISCWAHDGRFVTS